MLAPQRIAKSVAVRRRARIGKDFASYTVPTEDVEAEVSGATDLGGLLLMQDTRAVWKWTHYPPAYERELTEFRGKPVRLLELGVHRGGTLLAWRSYFGTQATVFGIDVDPASGVVDGENGVSVRIGSQDDPAFLRAVVAEMGGVDIVIDDGSHQAAHQRTSFTTLFPMLSSGGVYAVEDLHTSYWREYGGGTEGMAGSSKWSRISSTTCTGGITRSLTSPACEPNTSSRR